MDATRDPTTDELLAQMGWVRALARGLTADAAAAEDVAQDACALALERLPARERGGAPLRAWLARVTRSLAFGRRRGEARRTRRERAAARPEAEGSAADLAERAELHRRLAEAVAALDEPFRSAVVLRYLDGRPVSEVAALTAATPGTVRKRLERALERLRERLDRELGGRPAWWAVAARLARDEATALGGSTLVAAGVVAAAAAVGLVGWLALRPSVSPPAAGAAPAAEVADVDSAALALPPDVATPDARREAAAPGVGPVVRVAGTLRHVPFPGLDTPPDAGVEVSVSLGGGPDATVGSTRTREGGAFELELADPGEWPLPVQAFVAADRGHRFAIARATLEEGEREAAGLELVRAAHGPLSGRVVDSAGDPVAGLELVLGAPPSGGDEPLVTTDAAGAFTVDPFEGVLSWGGSWLSPGEPGWQIASAPSLRQLPGGGWEPATVVVAGAGALVLRCVDERGEAVAGVQASARMADSEVESQGSERARPSLFGEANEEGVLRLDAVWADRRLHVDVSGAHGATIVERRDGDRALPGETEIGTALVVPRGDEVELTLVFEPRAVVRGRVLGPAGVPAPGACVRLDEQRVSGRPEQSADLVAGEDGRFEWVCRVPLVGPRLRVVAADAPPVPEVDATWASRGPSVSLLAEASLQVGPGAPSEQSVELRLEPTAALSGRVVDAGGAPLETLVRALPTGASLSGFWDTMRSETAGTDGTGAFTLANLPPGTYDVLVDAPGRHVFTSNLARVRFGPFEAGTQGLELVLEELDPVRVEVTALAADGRDVARVGVVLGVVHPHDPDVRGRDPARDERFDDRAGWAPTATLALGGGQSFSRGEIGFVEGLYFGSKGPRHELPSVVEGTYWIGVRAWDASGRVLHPTGSDLLHLTPGEHRFAFVLDATGDLPGRVRTARADELRAALLAADGEPVLLRVGDRLQPDAPVGSRGDFRLTAAPVGVYELRVGTARELAAGTPALAVPVGIAEGENPPLDLVLP